MEFLKINNFNKIIKKKGTANDEIDLKSLQNERNLLTLNSELAQIALDIKNIDEKISKLDEKTESNQLNIAIELY